MDTVQQNVEDAYNLIKSHKNGLTIDEIWSQVKPYSAPYSIASLVCAGRIKLVETEEKLYCFSDSTKATFRIDRINHIPF